MSASLHPPNLIPPPLSLPPSSGLTQLPQQPLQLLIPSNPVTNNPVTPDPQFVQNPNLIITSSSMNASHRSPLPDSKPCLPLFGTKTAYPVPNSLQPLRYPSRDHASTPRLIHVSLVARHGTRNPTNRSISRMEILEAWLRNHLDETPQWLDEWSLVLDGYRKEPGMLTCHGQNELKSIGFRFAFLYTRNLQSMGGNIRIRDFPIRIRASYKKRAILSAKAFRDGYIAACHKFNLPPRITSVPTTSNLKTSDQSDETPSTLLVSPSTLNTQSPESFESDCSSQSSTSCESDTSEPASSPDAVAPSSPASSDDLLVEVLQSGHDAILRYFERNEEYATFANLHKAQSYKDIAHGPLWAKAMDVRRRVGQFFGTDKLLDIDLIRSVSEAAAFDTAHGRAHRSMFCAALTPEDHSVLEAFEQLHRPFFLGYQRYRNVCAPLIEDLMSSLDASVQRGKTKRNQEAHAIDLRFAHAETLVPVLLLLGIDSNGLPPSHPQYCQGLSGMSPFAANLALELYEDVKEGQIHHFVMFRLNERYVTSIPALGEHGRDGTVSLENLREFFREVVEDRNDDGMTRM